jgi:hypothetical protein
MILRSIVISSFLFGACAAAAADDLSEAGTPEQRAACSPDVRKFCFDLPKTSHPTEYAHCLMQHHDKLSEKCRVVIDGK